jgi:hypothetical protein
MNPNLKVQATWGLLGVSNSLPREVTYFDQSGIPVGSYVITGAELTGDTVIPTGFTFEEHRVPSDPSQALVLHKKVEAEVTSMSGVTPSQDLVPLPTDRVMVIDLRLCDPLFGPRTNHVTGPLVARPPSYLNPTPGKWPTVDEARKLVETNQPQQSLALPDLAPSRRPQ